MPQKAKKKQQKKVAQTTEQPTAQSEAQEEQPSEKPEAQEAEIVRISVRNLVEFILRSGDIDNRSGAGADKEAMQMGARLHRKIQNRMGSGYESEVSLTGTFPCEDFQIRLEGRADGIFTEEESHTGEQITVIDEIKGVFRELRFLEEPVPVHLAQAKCYAYLHALEEDLGTIGVRMSYGNLETEEMKYFQFVYTFEELEEWFFGVLDEYRKWAVWQRNWKRTRQESIQGLPFPFAYRDGQKQLAGDVYRTIRRGKILFIEAPTGVGKTISTVYPSVMAVGQSLGDKIFYLTAKTIARTVAAEAFDHLRAKGLAWKSVVLTAKEKICPLDTPECHPGACPYAKGHFDRINDAVYALITSEDRFTRESIMQAAERYRVCPFELSLDLTNWADGIIGDYNYVFHPRARLRRFFGDGVKGDYLFLIDEAHNLAERGREMFSAAIYKEALLEVRKLVKEESPRLSRALGRVNRAMLQMKREQEEPLMRRTQIGTFPITVTNLYGIMQEYLDDPDKGKDASVRQKVLDLYFEIGSFLETCDLLDEHYVIYTQLSENGGFMLRLYCVDPSENLQQCLDKARSSILFSATFLPIGYYKRLLSTREDNYAIYAKSCFDPGRCKVLIGADTSSRYTMRGPVQYQRMAAYICRTVAAHPGNYMVFFPSYRMLEDVEAYCRDELAGFADSICQQPGMREADREAFLQAFAANRERPLVGFCVMGSIFGEGIDLKEDRLIGTIIVGTGLPQVSPEVTLLQTYYEERGMDGFGYAYQYPGMNKVLQAAGRVIRTESDKGVIILLDERFTRPDYRRLFPREWESVETVSFGRLEERLQTFWQD